MATVNGQLNLNTTNPTVVAVQVDANSRIRLDGAVVRNNSSTDSTFDVAIHTDENALQSQHYFIRDEPILAKESFPIVFENSELNLMPGQKLIVTAHNADMAVTVTRYL